ncbi:protein kinase [Stigmatella sp. ncwal1]|uniref:Protein kinase n=1 Tax=Stigmatella ashevillensis TaxID=2995309 RepID=A0ABT5DKZ2_9BACT|nr:protein kinase [Stigmatella ashevillena]MDC0714201.1 protein kinase [Stigmatella ashevillena]
MTAKSFVLPRGAILFEMNQVHYEFREDLGEVYPGVHLLVARRRINEHRLNRVLVKALSVASASPFPKVKRARAKLEEQVRLTKFLVHPGIFEVHGLQKTQGTWYVVCEYPTGNTLSALLNLVGVCRHWYTPLFTMFIGARVADVLAYAHAAKDDQGRPLNTVHRAIDAEHIYLNWKGIVRVADFGLSLSDLPGRVPSTVNRPQGDGFYCSPEILLGKRADARSDLFSLGVLMLELATGKNLLYAPDEVTEKVKASLTPSQLRRVKRAIERVHLSGGPPLLEDAIWRAATYTQADLERLTARLPESLRVTLCKLLHPVPAQRFQTAAELVEHLRHWLGGTAFSQADVLDELKSVMDEAGRKMAGTELAHTLDENTTA